MLVNFLNSNLLELSSKCKNSYETYFKHEFYLYALFSFILLLSIDPNFLLKTLISHSGYLISIFLLRLLLKYVIKNEILLNISSFLFILMLYILIMFC